MIYKNDCTLPKEYLEQLTTEGLESLPEMIRVLVNEAMQIERSEYLNAKPYQRSHEPSGHANGYKHKTVRTRAGKVTFDIPQVREGGFYPGALEKGLRSERAFTLALAEMYVQGVSTRKVAAITERLCGTSVSAAQVSRAAKQLDEVLETWRNRPLGEVVYLYLDARYEKVRQAGNLAIVPDGSLLLIVNEMDQSVSMVDTATLTVTTTFPVDMSPADVAVAPNGEIAYVVGHASGNLTVLDLVNKQFMKTAPLPGLKGPYSVAFAPDGSAAYVAATDGGLSIIDPSSHQAVGHIDLPHAGWRGDLIINADGTTAYLASAESDWIMEIDLTDGQVARKFEVQKPQALLLSEDERLLYFGTFGSFLEIPPVGSIDLASGEIINPIMFNTPAPHVSWTCDIHGMAFDGDGSRIYVPGVDADGIFVIDVAAQKQSAFIPLMDYAVRQPEKLLINSDGSTLYTVNIAPQAPSISIVDTASRTVDTQFYLETDDPCFSQATSIALTPDDATVYVSTSSCLLTFDTASSTFTNSIPINIFSGTIRDIVFHPDGNSIYLIDSGGVVSAVDCTSFDVVSTVQAVEEGHNIKVSPDGTRVYVTGSRHYAAIDTATHTVVASDNVHVDRTEQFTSYPDRFIGIPPGHEFYTIGGFFYQQYMHVYDAATNKLLREIDLEPWAPNRTLASDAIFSPDGSTGYLALWDLKGISAFDTSTWELTAQIDLGFDPIYCICPNDFAFHPDGTYLYVSCEQSDNIMVIDTKMNQVIDVIQLVP